VSVACVSFIKDLFAEPEGCGLQRLNGPFIPFQFVMQRLKGKIQRRGPTNLMKIAREQYQENSMCDNH
jgi:hypothetical protein